MVPVYSIVIKVFNCIKLSFHTTSENCQKHFSQLVENLQMRKIIDLFWTDELNCNKNCYPPNLY